MKKFLILLALVLTGCSTILTDTIVRVGDREFRVEVADTPELRSQGLMYRTEVPTGTGMLFVFDEPQVVMFWMKNTLVPLDVAWITADGMVVGVEKMEPCFVAQRHCEHYVSPEKIRWALEVPAGALDGTIGERVEF